MLNGDRLGRLSSIISVSPDLRSKSTDGRDFRTLQIATCGGQFLGENQIGFRGLTGW